VLGSCWAHSTVSAVESIKKSKTGILEKLSSQELIDCVDGCDGCKSGWPELAFEYITRRGLSLESDYPNSDLNIQGECIVKSTNVKTFIAGYQSIQYMEDGAAENRLKHAVTFQPVVVVLLVGKEFSGYKAGDGIFQTEVDPAQDLSMAFHAVLVIGFGERDGNIYWLIRNSHGVQWGYGLIERDCGNLCGRCCIARFPVYPIWEVWNQFFCFHNFLKCLVYPLYLL
jgi:C1A family cysteine protease